MIYNLVLLSFLIGLVSSKDNIPNGIRLSIISPYGDTQFVHPDIYYDENCWSGWEYWMAVTPYPYSNPDYENPCVYVSHDGINWYEPEGVINPLTPTPLQGHYDDPDIFVYKDTMHIWFCHSYATVTLLDLWSVDGKVWHGPDTLLCPPGGASSLRSPACYVVGDTIFMWYQSGWPGVEYIVTLRKFAYGGGFLPAVDTCIIENIPSWKEPWHLDIEQNSSEHMLLCLCDSGTYGVVTYIAIAERYSQNTWILDTGLLLQPSDNGWDNGAIYRSSLYVRDNYYKIWYSAAGNGEWGLGYTAVTGDICPPASVENLKANSSNPSPWLSDSMFVISWTNPCDSSGIAKTLYKLGSAPINDYDTTGSMKEASLSGKPVSGGPAWDTLFSSVEGSVPLYVWLADSAGNVSYNNTAIVNLRYDVTPPVIQNTTKWDSTEFAGPFVVYAELSDLNMEHPAVAVSGVGKAELFYKKSSSTKGESASGGDSVWSSVLMTNNGNQYSGAIPVQSETTTISYYVYAEDNADTSNKITDPPDAPDSCYSFVVCNYGASEGVQDDSDILSVIPNPFVKTTTIKYDIPFESRVYIKLYAASGNVVKTITNDVGGPATAVVSPGRHFIKLESDALSSGVYFLRFYTVPTRPASGYEGQYEILKKLLLLK